MALTGAEKQKRHRERVKQRLAGLVPADDLPKLPAISSIPAERRWSVAVDRAKTALELVVGEMLAYSDDRSDEWKEGDKGEAFQERITILEEALEKLGELTI